MRRLALLLAFAVSWTLAGCAKKSESYASYDYYEPEPSYQEYDDYDDYGGEEYAEAPASISVESSRSGGLIGDVLSRAPSGRSYKADAAPARPAQSAAQQPSEPPPEEAPPEQAAARKVHYNGYASLLATDPEDTVAAVVALAEERGGFVERRSLSDVTVRVPVDRFQETFDDILDMGEVLDKSLTAQDVTDAFQSAELRLGTARATRARLQELLAQAKTEEEKLALLKQIQRLTEEIDLLESRLRTLGGLADFSRLTVRATPRQAYVGNSNQPDISGFSWIRRLSPFRRDVAQSGRPLNLDPPAGLVALDLERHFVAESADGSVVWSGRLRNDPVGDTAYWLAAITQRLDDEFSEVTVSEEGGFSIARMVEPGADDPYRYLVAVRADGRWLELVEIYYPSGEQEERYGESVRAMLRGSRS